MEYNFQRLKGRIKEYYGNQDLFANELKISTTSLNNKLNNKTKFSYDEVQIMIDKLHINPTDINSIFFTKNVRK